MKAALIVGVALIALAGFAIGHHYRKRSDPVALTFQRYSDVDPYVGDVAFMYLTNGSERSCTLFMTGNTNTLVMDTDTLMRVWCDRALTNQWDRAEQP